MSDSSDRQWRVTHWIDQLFNQNPTICSNFPSFPLGEREKVGHAGSDGEIATKGPSLTDAIFSPD